MYKNSGAGAVPLLTDMPALFTLAWRGLFQSGHFGSNLVGKWWSGFDCPQVQESHGEQIFAGPFLLTQLTFVARFYGIPEVKPTTFTIKREIVELVLFRGRWSDNNFKQSRTQTHPLQQSLLRGFLHQVCAEISTTICAWLVYPASYRFMRASGDCNTKKCFSARRIVLFEHFL